MPIAGRDFYAAKTSKRLKVEFFTGDDANPDLMATDGRKADGADRFGKFNNDTHDFFTFTALKKQGQGS